MMVVGGSSATSFEDLDSMARMEQVMENDGYDVVASWVTDLHGDDLYMFVFNMPTGSSTFPRQAINDTALYFASCIYSGFSVDGMAVMCGFNDGYYGCWYIDALSAAQVWRGASLDWYYGEIIETYYVAEADF